jgi:hypothetical protein
MRAKPVSSRLLQILDQRFARHRVTLDNGQRIDVVTKAPTQDPKDIVRAWR